MTRWREVLANAMVIKIPLYLFQFLLIVFPILLDISEHFYNHLILLIVPLQNSVNARYQTIPYPWLVFGEKVKVNTVFIRDSTGISDSILILFGGTLSRGAMVISSIKNIYSSFCSLWCNLTIWNFFFHLTW